MKNVLLTTALLFITVIQSYAGHGPKSFDLTVLGNEKSVILKLASTGKDVELFTMMDSKGDILINQIVRTNDKNVKYDLSRLPNGTYTIKVDGTDYVELFETTISNEDVEIAQTAVFHRPALNLHDKKIILAAELDEDEKIGMTIYNASGDLVYEFEDQSSGDFQKSFNLKELASGDYSVFVSTNYFSESKKITL